MKLKLTRLLLLTFLLTACGAGTPAPVTHMHAATQPPTDIPTQTALLTLAIPPSPTAVSPYPTASVVKSNAVAFIAENALWVANVDGSGERKLTDIDKNAESISKYLLQWSPDGKWISYISDDDLWIISPYGSDKRKILSIKNTDKIIRKYGWSPDSTRVAYTSAPSWGDFIELKTGLLDLTTEKDSEIYVYQSPANIVLSWSPDGRYLLLNTRDSIKVFGVGTGKIAKEINSACPIWHGTPTWSPNSEWFFRSDYGTGYYYIWVCMNGLNGTSWQAIDGVISEPVWDKTGDYLYFVSGKMDLEIGSNWFTNQRLMRYNVKTRKSEELLSLEEDGPMGFPPIVFLSPNGQMLGLYLYMYRKDNELLLKQKNFFILDVHSLSMVKYTLELEGDISENYPSPTWSPDNENIIFLSETNGCFYKFNVRTGKETVISGKHSIEYSAVSPIATTP